MFGIARSIFGLRELVAPESGTVAGAVSHPIPLRRLWWAAILLLGLAAGAVGWTIWQLRTDAIRAAVSETGNIATVLAGQLSGSVKAIDDVLLDIKRSTRHLDIDTPAGLHAALGRREIRDELLQLLARVPQVFNIAIADKDGQIVVSTAGWPTPDISVSDRDFFQDARNRTDGELSASIPAKNKIDGKRTIVFARRLENARGDFDGIVFAGVNTKYFEDIYGVIQSVHSLLFTLLKPDGTILFRHPEDHNSAGTVLSHKSGWLETLSSGDAGFRVVGQADGNLRFVSIRRLPQYPLIVDISVTESTSLAAWRRRAAAIGFGSSVFLLFSIYLLWSINRQVRCLSHSEASLTQKSQQLDAALNNMSQGLTMHDGQQRLLVSNTQFAKIYGLTSEQTKPGTLLRTILEARIAAGSVPQDVTKFLERSLDQTSQPKFSNLMSALRDGRTISISRQPMSNGGWVSIHQDITEQRRIEAELERMARYDALTGLANRTLFMEEANAELARMRRNGDEFSLMMLDLDQFKSVNDSLGHPAGDALLKEAARRMLGTIRDVDRVARLGGDEFAVLQAPEKNQKDSAVALADRILRAIVEPYELDGRKIILEVSIGIALAPQDGKDADALIKNADLALYKAKSVGRNRYCLFDASMEAKGRARRELENELRKAISRNEFELHYQTIVDLGRRDYCAAEALVRWRHPRLGFTFPGEFIPLAEATGLIVPLGEWILRRACADAAKWPPHVKVAVNLSPAQFKQGDLLGVLRTALNDTGLAPHRLELEITETVLLEKNEGNLAILHEIRSLGVSIVLDDFGVGYSSMSYLQMFPFDRIKIDQSFIQNMTYHATGSAIVCAIAGLGRNLGIETTAEGVETEDQLVLLRASGCQSAQGYLFSRPVAASDLDFEPPKLLREGTKAA